MKFRDASALRVTPALRKLLLSWLMLIKFCDERLCVSEFQRADFEVLLKNHATKINEQPALKITKTKQ